MGVDPFVIEGPKTTVEGRCRAEGSVMAQGRLFKEFEAARAAAENRGADAGGPGRPEASRKPAGKEAGMTRADLKAHQRKAAGPVSGAGGGACPGRGHHTNGKNRTLRRTAGSGGVRLKYTLV